MPNESKNGTNESMNQRMKNPASNLDNKNKMNIQQFHNT